MDIRKNPERITVQFRTYYSVTRVSHNMQTNIESQINKWKKSILLLII